MSAGRSYLERLLLGRARGPLSWAIRAPLWVLSIVYRVGLAAYLGLEQIGLRRRLRLPARVISVGGLTFGGVGKTPAVQEISRMLGRRGKRVAILSRGHGGKARGPLIVSDGNQLLTNAVDAGDEPVLLAQTLPGVPVAVGKDRRKTGALVCERFRPDVILLDDGFQYWQLHRDLDIVLLDAARPFGSGFVMPAGDLREPVGGLRRAGAVVLVGEDYVTEAAVGPLRRIASNAAVLRARRVPTDFVRAASDEHLPLEWVLGRSVAAFCGIGSPGSFFQMLEALGARTTVQLDFPDHHAYTESDMAALICQLRASQAEALVTTEKDLIRLPAKAITDNIYVLRIRLEIEEAERRIDA